MVPGKRSAAAEHYEAHGEANEHAPGGMSGPGRGASPPLFSGPAQWEDILDEDPMAQDEALQPDADDGDAGPADEEGELDADGEVEEDEEAAVEPQAAAAPASEPGHAAATPHASTDHSARMATSGHREGAHRDGAHREAAHGEAAQPEGRELLSARAASAGKTYHVNRSYRDGPFAGTAKYDVRVTAKDITITVGVRLTPKRGVTRGQVKHVKQVSQEIFKQKYDGHFRVTEIPYRPRPLRMRVRFSHPNPHHNVALHKGAGRDNAANWYVKSPSIVRAHEIGHLLGLKDEYFDKKSPKRKVYTDNSLMGNYYAEGIRAASLKPRHGNTFARDISRASGRRFRISS